MSNKLSPAKKAWITRKIKSGKSKYQTAKELKISYQTVCKFAIHLPNHPKGRTGIRGETLEMLQELVKNGHSISSSFNVTQKYNTLKKYFPTIHRTRYKSKTILFLEDKANDAVKAYLSQLPDKIMSYQELKQITKLFHTNLTKKEKKMFLGKNKY